MSACLSCNPSTKDGKRKDRRQKLNFDTHMKIFKTIITACLILTVFSCKKDKVDMGNYNVESF